MLQMLVFEESKNWSNQRETSRRKGVNQQQTQPTFGADARTQTQASLVGGACSHHYATLAPNIILTKYV